MSNCPNLVEIVVRAHEDIQPHFCRGRLADYIPALARVDPRQFGLAIVTCRGETASAGNCSVPFSIGYAPGGGSFSIALTARRKNCICSFTVRQVWQMTK
jgi:glutaminase